MVNKVVTGFPAKFIFTVLLVLSIAGGGIAQGLYFPPLVPAQRWDTISPVSMEWCTEKIAPLYDFLEQENTKGFMVLKDGKIALEKYFGTFTRDSIWYWASAGKTVTAFLVGRAREEGHLSIDDSSSRYLGQGWTSCTAAQEEKINIRNQLTMTSGLDDGVPDNHCTIDTCLEYLANAGTRWAYHNAPYTLLEKVLVHATGQSINSYTRVNLNDRTGIAGLWLTVDYDNVFFSTLRSMARFGLLMQNRGAWGNDTLLHDTVYVHQMLNTSQTLNNAYGYLWWLNGKPSFMIPGTQVVFPGFIAPHAPSDMYAGLGKNGQIVSVSPEKGIVIVRMGNLPGSPESEFTGQFCDQIWQKLNEVMCNSSGVAEMDADNLNLQVYPNPAQNLFTVELPQHRFSIAVYDMMGRIMFEQDAVMGKIEISCRNYSEGVYNVKIITPENNFYNKTLVILKNRP
ncbi:MAG: serine hydrolase [Bacteroidetes bacterium]|nr:serine hydrolase [Bacteroidota bacterium]